MNLDNQVEKALVLTVPHRVLIGDDEPSTAPGLTPPSPSRRLRSGRIVSSPVLGGPHHRYERRVA